MLQLISRNQRASLRSRGASVRDDASFRQVTQPTLSAGIKQLEEQLGLLVVQRGQRTEGGNVRRTAHPTRYVS
jgi:DNA-binding transcriptional LysR family regulator